MAQALELTGPEQAFSLLLRCLLLGLGLGIVYGFLRPLRPRHRMLSDLLFLPAALYAWVYAYLALCRGAMRFVYAIAILAGAVAWELTLGKWLRPVFGGFWDFVGRIWGGFLRPLQIFFKKTANFQKNLFASGKKWVILNRKDRKHHSHPSGGTQHGRHRKLS